MTVSEAMLDVMYPLRGDTIADDYAWLLWREIEGHLPWLSEEPGAGVLPLAGLSRGAGLHFVGGRARLIVRMPQRRLASADFLAGTQLDLNGMVEVGQPTTRKIESARVVHSPCVDANTADEGEFQRACKAELEARGMTPELVCGRGRQLRGDDTTIHAFSLMLYGLKPDQTLALQEQGLGHHHHLGCGIFVPHKNVAAVGSE